MERICFKPLKNKRNFSLFENQIILRLIVFKQVTSNH